MLPSKLLARHVMPANMVHSLDFKTVTLADLAPILLGQQTLYALNVTQDHTNPQVVVRHVYSVLLVNYPKTLHNPTV
jgi:hypothetical protein